MRYRSPIRWSLVLMFSFLLLAGCSSRYEPTAPEFFANDGSPEDAGEIQRGAASIFDLSFERAFELSAHGNYTEIAGFVGVTGGTVSGTVPGYEGSFSLQVPSGAYLGLSDLRILVPNAGIPVYQLLPHTNFNHEVTVTLGYSKWLDEGVMKEGALYEILYMNEQTGEFEQLSPRAVFSADAGDPMVSFITDHFSRWIFEELDD